MPEFQRIASYANAADADHLKAVLQDHGIRAFVEGGDLQTSLSYIGSALGGVHVTVRSADADKAIEIKDELSRESHEPTGGPWYCGECEEIVDAGFQVCWKCGQDRSKVEAAMPATADLDDEEEEEYLSGDSDHPRPDRAHFDESNPYASPQTKVEGAEKTRKPREINEDAEAMLIRAWRAAILGLAVIPMLANIYSMYMLFAALKETNQFTPEGNWRFNVAFFLNLLSGIAWGAILIVLTLPVSA